MELKKSRIGEVLALAASGRIDHQSAEAFQKALDPHLAGCVAGGDAIVLDMAEVDYVSSVGLRVLLMASKRAAAQKGRIVVAAMQPNVGEVFRISQFDRILPVYDTVEAAAAGLQA
ncbi:MAG: STAS domain-containing protein [Alphaproteobacteria bacterium]